jgi:hypothetical protein
MDFVVVGSTGTLYVINDWGTNQDDGGLNGGVKPSEYNRFTFSMNGDDYEVRIFPDGTSTILKNGSLSTLPGFVSAFSWTTSPNLPTTNHTIWEFSFVVPGTPATYAWIGADPKGPTIITTAVPPSPPTGLQTGASAFTHFVDGSFADSFVTPNPPPNPSRAAQPPVRDPHFDIYDQGNGWTVQVVPGGGVLIKASFLAVPTLSEWGMIFMTLLLLVAGTIVWGYRAHLAPAGGTSAAELIVTRSPLFPALFGRTLAATAAAAIVGLACASWIVGDLAIHDVAGVLLCAPLLAYLLHLWMGLRR